MANTIKALFEGTIPSASTNVYTVPSGKYAVSKSIVICNGDSAVMTFTLIIGGVNVAYSHNLAGYETLIIDDLDIPMLGSETITMLSSTVNGRIVITGFERDYVAEEFPYLKIIANYSGWFTLPANDFDSILKSIVICNPNSTESRGSVMQTSSLALIYNKTIKPRDTVIIPLPKIFVPKGRQLMIAGTSSGLRFAIIFEKVVQ
ncbi:hypothetical protein [Paenibacillus xylanexedens]|uniref:hypothetical protein n=1 Tax=Paenibacillus xylanexedens TaxID=528191 RepID=UPI003B025A0E